MRTEVSKYECLCGFKFNQRKTGDFHLKIFPDHIVVKKMWKKRVFEFFYNWPWRPIFRSMGFLIIYFVILSHFNIILSFKEAMLMGLGIGMYIE